MKQTTYSCDLCKRHWDDEDMIPLRVVETAIKLSDCLASADLHLCKFCAQTIRCFPASAVGK